MESAAPSGGDEVRQTMGTSLYIVFIEILILESGILDTKFPFFK